MAGPYGTPYQGGIYTLDIVLSDKYPQVPPTVRMRTKIFHPNIDRLGNICLEILATDPDEKSNKWKPHLQIRDVSLEDTQISFILILNLYLT